MPILFHCSHTAVQAKSQTWLIPSLSSESSTLSAGAGVCPTEEAAHLEVSRHLGTEGLNSWVTDQRKCQTLGLELWWRAASWAKRPGADRHKGKSADSVQAQLPGAAPAPPLLPTGLSCRKRIELQRVAPPSGLHGPGRAGNKLPLGLKSEQEQSHVATGTQVATSAECPDSPAPIWPHCLTGACYS